MASRTHLIVTLVTMILPGLYADDWKFFGRDLEHSSFNSVETSIRFDNVTRLAPAWTLAMGMPYAAAVSIADGTLYVGGWDGYFRAIKASDGTVLWSQFVGLVPAPEDPTCFPVVGVSAQAAIVGDNVYVGGGDSAVYAFQSATGNLLWRKQIGDPSTGAYLWSSITVYNNSLYIGVASLADCPLTRGSLVRIDLDHPDTPQIRYLVPQDQTGAGIWSTAAIDKDTNTVFVTTGTGDPDATMDQWGSTLLSLDASSLEIQNYFFLPDYSTDEDIEWGSSPTLFVDANNTPLVGATGKDGVLYVLRRQDLSLVWQATLAVKCVDPVQGCGAISAPAFDGQRLYVGAGVADPNSLAGGSLYALDPTTGSVIWSLALDGAVLAPLTVANGLVFAPTTKGLEIHDAATGATVWTDQGYGALYSQTVVSDGVFYSTYVNGDVVARRVSSPTPPQGPRPSGGQNTRTPRSGAPGRAR